MPEASPLGVVGGLGPEATIYYYRFINRLCRQRCGHAPRLLVYSLPLEEMCTAVKNRDLEKVSALLLEALEALARAGASTAIIAANTPHIAWSLVEPKARSLGLRLVSIVEAAAARLQQLGARSAGILATTGTLESRIYHEALSRRGIEAVEPSPGDQEWLDRAIAERFAHGEASERDVEKLMEIAGGLAARADAVLVACTDLSPFFEDKPSIAGKPVVDSAREQVLAALREGSGCSCP